MYRRHRRCDDVVCRTLRQNETFCQLIKFSIAHARVFNEWIAIKLDENQTVSVVRQLKRESVNEHLKMNEPQICHSFFRGFYFHFSKLTKTMTERCDEFSTVAVKYAVSCYDMVHWRTIYCLVTPIDRFMVR